MDPYRMVVVHFVAFCFLLGFIFVRYKKAKPLKPFHILVLVLFLPLMSIFRAGTYESGDLTFQAYKTLSFYNSLKEGILIPRWSAELNGTYGYPNFIFAYQLPYYITSFFHFSGFDLIKSVKLLLISTYFFSGVFFYAWIRKHVNDFSALCATILYIFAPYRFVDLHFRATPGENTAFMILPLTFFSTYLVISKKTFIYEVFAGMTLALLILSHQAISLISIPSIFAYGMVLSYVKQGTFPFRLLRAYSIGLLLSAYYWIPLIIESRYTLQSAKGVSVLFPQTWEYFVSPWMYGFLFQGHYGELSPSIGYVHIIILLYCIFILLFKRSNVVINTTTKIFVSLFTCLSIFYILLAQEWTYFLWSWTPLHRIQFAMRFLPIIIFTTASLGGFIAQAFSKKTLSLLMILIISITILNWGNRRMITYPDRADFESFAPYITILGEGLDPAIPKWVDPENPWKSDIPEAPLESPEPSFTFTVLDHSYLHRTYNIQTSKVSLIHAHLYYFPGWKVLIDTKSIPIDPTYKNHLGSMTFIVPPGEHILEITFTQTYIRTFSLIISIVTLCIICLEVLRTKKSPLHRD